MDQALAAAVNQENSTLSSLLEVNQYALDHPTVVAALKKQNIERIAEAMRLSQPPEQNRLAFIDKVGGVS